MVRSHGKRSATLLFLDESPGVKYDALNAMRGLSGNRQRDAQRDVATKITEHGWNAEFERLFGQGSTCSDVYTFRALLGREYQPDSSIYLAYEQWRDDSEGEFRITNHGVFLKVDRFLHF